MQPTLDLSLIENLKLLESPKRPNFTRDMIKLFLTAAGTGLPELRAFNASADFDSVHKLAHRLKSGALSIGALRFGELCEQIEKAGKANVASGTQTSVSETIDALEVEFAEARTALQNVV